MSKEGQGIDYAWDKNLPTVEREIEKDVEIDSIKRVYELVDEITSITRKELGIDKSHELYEKYLMKVEDILRDPNRYQKIINNDSTNTQSYYKGKNSLYKFAEEWGLNSYEFDLIKRIIRCRHKGQFLDDLNKTKALIDIYIKEYETK